VPENVYNLILLQSVIAILSVETKVDCHVTANHHTGVPAVTVVQDSVHHTIVGLPPGSHIIAHLFVSTWHIDLTVCCVVLRVIFTSDHFVIVVHDIVYHTVYNHSEFQPQNQVYQYANTKAVLDTAHILGVQRKLLQDAGVNVLAEP
jgi:hypothetical protein